MAQKASEARSGLRLSKSVLDDRQKLQYVVTKDGAALFLRRDEKSDTWEYYLTPDAMAFALDVVKEYVR
jgi:hypothetical protein